MHPYKNGKFILWEHLKDLHTQSQADSGMYIDQRLKCDHVHLTPYSKMKVNLAVQVHY
jgi:hypothetical protein